ncbi:MAG: CoA transferase subunit A [Acidimicrobiia bacterium]
MSFVDARERLEAVNRPPRDKRMALAEALDLVKDGDHVAIGGSLYSRTPFAALMELIRKRRKELVLSRSLMCYEGEMFLAAGSSRQLLTSWMSIGLPWGIAKVMRRYVEQGKAEFEEWSHLALALRYKAGAMGLPFLPSLTMLGSDLHESVSTKEMTCPFTGERLSLIPALFPDVALVHVHRADQFGNAQVDGYTHMDADIVRAAQSVIVTAEEIVEPEVMEADGTRTLFPHFVVDAVVEVPYGAFPHECYGRYDADFDHFDEYVALSEDDDGMASYLQKYVHDVADHDEFLALFGESRLKAAADRAIEILG